MKHIVISNHNYEQLKNIGEFQNTFNDVVTKLLKKALQHDSQLEIVNQIATDDTNLLEKVDISD